MGYSGRGHKIKTLGSHSRLAFEFAALNAFPVCFCASFPSVTVHIVVVNELFFSAPTLNKEDTCGEKSKLLTWKQTLSGTTLFTPNLFKITEGGQNSIARKVS